ncbi:MAG: hypothetical protein V8Q79_07625 [Christensenellales bacterium]
MGEPLLFGVLGFCLTRCCAVRMLPILFAVLLGRRFSFPAQTTLWKPPPSVSAISSVLFAEETFDLPAESTPEALETRRENRRSLAEGDGQAQKNHAYRLQTQLEKQVSVPDLWNIPRVVLIVLLILALLIVPFLPFLAGKRRKAEEALRARMKSDDSRERSAPCSPISPAFGSRRTPCRPAHPFRALRMICPCPNRIKRNTEPAPPSGRASSMVSARQAKNSVRKLPACSKKPNGFFQASEGIKAPSPKPLKS